MAARKAIQKLEDAAREAQATEDVDGGYLKAPFWRDLKALWVMALNSESTEELTRVAVLGYLKHLDREFSADHARRKRG